jgi:hypothetical protein
MQKIELSGYSDINIHCPFCGKKVWLDEGVDTCEHTLFHAWEEGFAYAHDILGISDTIELPENSNMDQYTDALNVPEDTIKFAVYGSMSCYFGRYVAFAPNI